VSELLSPPIQDIYVVEFVRHPGDLGVSVIVHANCEAAAKLEAWRLWPEYKHYFAASSVHQLDFCEIDWETGRCFISKRRKRTPIPVFTLDEHSKRPRNTKREEGAQ
jgi:hypothetical protein